MVLPTVATKTAGQNNCGASFTNPNTAGSEPIGNSVADTSEITKTALSPTEGSANLASSQLIAESSVSSMASV
jgi:hypothetical protein